MTIRDKILYDKKIELYTKQMFQWTIPQLDKLSNWKTIFPQLERAS